MPVEPGIGLTVDPVGGPGVSAGVGLPIGPGVGPTVATNSHTSLTYHQVKSHTLLSNKPYPPG